MKLRLTIVPVLALMLMTACQSSSTLQGPEPGGSSTPEAVQRSLSTVDPEEHLHLFDYDRIAPFDVVYQAQWKEGRSTWIDFTYASPLGGRVPARLGLPGGTGPFPAILLMHGSDGHIERFTGVARQYVQLGAAVLLIDAPHVRPGGHASTGMMGDSWPHLTEKDRLDQIQLMVDLQRAIDILIERSDINPERLAYIGYSYGGAMGGLLAGIEQRLKAYVLVVGDGGLVEHLSQPLENGMPNHWSERWIEAMWPIEPIHYVGRAAPAALLFQNGLQDELVPPGDALRYQVAGSEPKTVMWYDAGHGLEPNAFRDASFWLQAYLGDDLLWMAPDYHRSARWADWGFTAWLLLLAGSVVVVTQRERVRLSSTGVQTSLWILAALVVGPVAWVLHIWSYNSSQRSLGFDRIDVSSWRTSLGLAVMASVIYLIGTIAGNLVSFQLLGGNFIVLTYLLALFLGWIVFWIFRSSLPIRPLAWLLSVNLIWAGNVLLSYPLMNLWRLSEMLHPRLLWYAGNLSLFNLFFIYVLFRVMARYDLVGWRYQRGRADGEPRGLPWPWSIAAILATYAFDFFAVIFLIANYSGNPFLEVLRSLPQYFS
jgi:dienelactone hydrolase